MGSVFGSGPVTFVENEFFIRSLFDLSRIYLSSLIKHQDFLLLMRIKVNVVFESIHKTLFASEEDSGREILLERSLPLLFRIRSFFCETTINRLIINNYFEFMNTSIRCFTIIPKSHSTNSFRLVENN